MSKGPTIVPVSDLRRDTARLIAQAFRTHEPLYITQRGYVTAVLLSREQYDTMCVLRDRGMRAINPRAIPGQPPTSIAELPTPIDDWDV